MRNEWRRTGSRRSEQVLPPRSWSLHLLVSFLQENKRVAAGENKIGHASAAQRGLLVAGPPCKIDMLGACDLHGLGNGDCLLGIDLVGGAQAGQPRAGRLAGSGEGGGGGKALPLHAPASARLP